MAFHQDYMMRQIQDMVRAIMRVINIKTADENEEVLPEQKVSEGASFLDGLKKLVDEGKINEAENRLYEALDENDPSFLKLALSFYDYMNAFPNDFLEENGYTRKEIADGIEDIAERYGYGGFGSIMTYQ